MTREISPGKYMLNNGTIILDNEYIEAYEKAKNEEAIYYTVSYLSTNLQPVSFIKQYKPSIAELFAKRTGKTYTPCDLVRE